LPLQSEADERAVLDELLSSDETPTGAASGEVLSFLQNGYPPKLLKQLRRGQFRIEGDIDLHHLRLLQAKTVLAEFFRHSKTLGHRCLRIVHGKGRADGSVLKAMVDGWLRQRGDVIGFVSARPADGGTGAVLVLLRG
jgi:DNA-nicking Smr family endonuclease